MGFQDQCSEISWAWPLKNFRTDLEDFSGIYLKKSLQTSTWFFKGILKGLLLDPSVFAVTLYPGWVALLLWFICWLVHGKCSDWGWAELLYSYKILTQQSSPNTNPDPYYTILYYIIPYNTILYYIILYYTILYYIIPYYTILYYIILYNNILYYFILYYTILYSIILYYTILDYIIQYYIGGMVWNKKFSCVNPV